MFAPVGNALLKVRGLQILNQTKIPRAPSVVSQLPLHLFPITSPSICDSTYHAVSISTSLGYHELN